MTDNSGLTILNVDDNEAGRYAVTRILRHAGYRVVEAATGAEVMAQLEKEPIQLVILDINLPDTSGLELCSSMKDHPRYARIPVLHLTATYVMSMDLLEESRADGYLMQPVEPAALLANVRALIRARRTETRLEGEVDAWRSALDSLDEGIAVVDNEGRVLRANRAFAAAIGEAEAAPAALVELVDRVAVSGRKEASLFSLGDRGLRARAYPLDRAGDEDRAAVVMVSAET